MFNWLKKIFRKDQPKKDQPKKAQTQRDQTKRDQPKRDQPKRDQPKRDQPNRDQPRKDQPGRDQPKRDQPRRDQPKRDQGKRDQGKPVRENRREERTEKIPGPDDAFIWCLMGSIDAEFPGDAENEAMHGTKHFSQNTKVHCFPLKQGESYEKVKVVGRHRKSKRNICIVMPAKYITNWKLEKVHRPYILKVMEAQHGWTNSDQDKEAILNMAKELSERKTAS